MPSLLRYLDASRLFGSGPSEVLRLMILFRGLLFGLVLLSSANSLCIDSNAQCSAIDILGPSLIVYALSLASIYWLRKHQPDALFTWIQFITDVAVICSIIYLSGGPISPFLFLFLPLVMLAAFLRGRDESLLLGAIAITAYTIIARAMLSGMLLALDQEVVITPKGGLLVQILGLVSAMALCVIGTSFLQKKLALSSQLVERSQRALSELSNQQRLLIEGMSQGVIIADLNDAISSINQAAQSLLRIESDEALGRSVNELLPLNQRDQLRDEISIERSDDRQNLRLKYHSSELRDQSGHKNGSILIFEDITHLRSVEEQLAVQERLAQLLAQQNVSVLESSSSFGDFVGESTGMREVFSLIQRVASSDVTLLIAGESGTGKELVARAVHKRSKRSSAPFIAVNCAAIPENLIESELFGHKKGSFTSAVSDSLGLFRQADGGTIFLDEISELPLHLQSKLLRVIQERLVQPVGSEKSFPINLRIISATNRDLLKAVSEQTFRDDLYYRLNVVSIKLPALRERKDDIPLLVSAIIKRLSQEGQSYRLSPQALQLLMQYDYPGNVRELENILERALVIGGSVILPEHLPENVQHAKAVNTRETQILIDETLELPIDLDQLLAKIEKRYLESALEKSSGIKKNAAELLGMNFRSLRYRLEKFGLE
jgi:two-component system response regulator PilR (NtrC family)